MKMSDLLNPVGRTRSRSDFLSAQICATTACSLDQNLALGLYSTQSSWYCTGWTQWSLRTTGVGPSVFDEISSSEGRWDKNVAAMPLATAWGICILSGEGWELTYDKLFHVLGYGFIRIWEYECSRWMRFDGCKGWCCRGWNNSMMYSYIQKYCNSLWNRHDCP